MKPGYKQTEVGVIPEEWEVKPLGEIGEALIGLTYKPTDVRQHGTLVLRSSNIQNDALAFDDNVFVDAAIPERIRVLNDDVLICVRNGSRDLIGKSALLDDRTKGMTFGAFMAVYRSQIGRLASYLFQSAILKRQINEHLGATINQITNKSINSFRIPVPTPPEQRAIATALSDVDGLLGGLDRLIAKKRDLKQAAMQQLLTGQTRLPGFHGEWEVKRLDAIADVIDPHPSHRAPDEVSNGVPFVGIGDLDETGNLVGTKLRYVDRSVLVEHSARYNLDDQLIGLGRVASIGKVVCLKPLPEGFAISPTLGVIRGRSVQRGYLLYALRSKFITEQFTRIMSGSTRSSVGMEVLRKLNVLLPPTPAEQTAIAEVMSEMDGELAVLEQRREKTRALKQAMMQELLTGRTRLI